MVFINLPRTHADSRSYLTRQAWPGTECHRFAIENQSGAKSNRSWSCSNSRIQLWKSQITSFKSQIRLRQSKLQYSIP